MSDTPKMDKDRRTWLIATSAVGGCGAAAVAYPFLDSFQPSERAKLLELLLRLIFLG